MAVFGGGISLLRGVIVGGKSQRVVGRRRRRLRAQCRGLLLRGFGAAEDETDQITRSVVGVHEAKTHLSQLLDRVTRGEEVLIARRGRVVAHLVPPPVEERRLGLDVGRLDVPADFDAPLPDELLDAFAPR